MTLAEAHAGDGWLAAFEAFVRGWRQGEFTGEEMRRHAAAAIGEPASCRAWGAAMRGLATRVIIEQTGRYRARRQTGNPAPVWRLK